MKAFTCQYCGQPLYFENRLCPSCGRRLGYIAPQRELSALEPSGGSPDIWRALSDPGRTYRFCANTVYDSCNWLVPAGPDEPAFCQTCRHNHIIPDLSSSERLERWRKIQVAQHRLFDALLALRIPLTTRVEDPRYGLGFDILYDPHENAPQGPSIMTGHDDGLITLNLMEADDSVRERVRRDMDEPYRTLLGHFRHEVGHYVWQRMIADGPLIEAFRATFGDERRSYADALRQHYDPGEPPADWREHYVSAYASSHPWEDFAETWAHYLHMVATLDTAAAFGVRLFADGEDPADLDPYGEISLDRLIGVWLPLTFAVNSLNRSMGQPDLYPFLPEPAVIAKLAFVHDLVRSEGRTVAEPDRSRHALNAVIAGLKARVGNPDAR